MSLGSSKHDKTFIIFTLHINIKVLENLIFGEMRPHAKQRRLVVIRKYCI